MKIGQFLSTLITEINSELTATPLVELANIATLNDGDEFLSSKSAIVLSVVNIEEDIVLKNSNPYIDSRKIIYKNRRENLLLSLLFSSYHTDPSKYTEGLDKLDEIIQYFHDRSLFHWQDSIFLSSTPTNGSYSTITFRITSQKADQVSQMWSYLGARYLPSVLYHVQIISVEEDDISPDVKIVTI